MENLTLFPLYQTTCFFIPLVAPCTPLLTKNELGILRLLMVNKGNIIPRDAIIDELWQSEQFIDENTLNVNIVRLRKALAEIGLPDYLETKRGLGYCV